MGRSAIIGWLEDSIQGFEIRWRLHICLWAASHAIQLPGSFVECGVGLGFMSLAIMQYLDWNSRDRQFYLFDTFCGLDETQLSKEEILLGRLTEGREFYSECFEQVEKKDCSMVLPQTGPCLDRWITSISETAGWLRPPNFRQRPSK